MEEVIADRVNEEIGLPAGLTGPGSSAGLERVRGTGLAMLRGWHESEQRSQATIHVSSQRDLRIQRFVIPAATAGRWVVHDIRIQKENELPRSGLSAPTAGAMFSPEGGRNGLDRSIEDALAPSGEIRVIVEYVGDDPNGEVFRAVLVGRDGQTGAEQRLTVDSQTPVFPAREVGKRVWIWLDGPRLLDAEMYRFEEREHVLDRIVRVPCMPTGLEPNPLREPRMISLHVVDVFDLARPMGVWSEHWIHPTLVGIDDATSRVVFEIGNTQPCPPESAAAMTTTRSMARFHAKCDLAGYVPDWWDRTQVETEIGIIAASRIEAGRCR